MHYLPNVKLLDTDDIEIYSNKNYDITFINRFSDFFTKKKISILNFFNLSSFRKVRINLFDSKEEYYNFSKQYIRISSYSIGNCCSGMINYVCNDEDLVNFAKTRLSYC